MSVSPAAPPAAPSSLGGSHFMADLPLHSAPPVHDILLLLTLSGVASSSSMSMTTIGKDGGGAALLRPPPQLPPCSVEATLHLRVLQLALLALSTSPCPTALSHTT